MERFANTPVRSRSPMRRTDTEMPLMIIDQSSLEQTFPTPSPFQQAVPLAPALSPSWERPAYLELPRSEDAGFNLDTSRATRTSDRDNKIPFSGSALRGATGPLNQDAIRARPSGRHLYDPKGPLHRRTEGRFSTPNTLLRSVDLHPSQQSDLPSPIQTPQGAPGIGGISELQLPVHHTVMLKKPGSRHISNDQLTAEVNGIYAGLVIVEKKCIDIDFAQTTEQNRAKELSNDQWQALTALHRTLLYEHHDLLLASQHPSAGETLECLASDYNMPCRMWKHAIHAYLEVLRQHLPRSIELMLDFIYLSYQMIALLYETVPLFEDTWIECLGDLGRYRMAIEKDDVRDREIWGCVARYWYSEASDNNPSVGRLYHHLGILARPSALH